MLLLRWLLLLMEAIVIVGGLIVPRHWRTGRCRHAQKVGVCLLWLLLEVHIQQTTRVGRLRCLMMMTIQEVACRRSRRMPIGRRSFRGVSRSIKNIKRRGGGSRGWSWLRLLCRLRWRIRGSSIIVCRRGRRSLEIFIIVVILEIVIDPNSSHLANDLIAPSLYGLTIICTIHPYRQTPLFTIGTRNYRALESEVVPSGQRKGVFDIGQRWRVACLSRFGS